MRKNPGFTLIELLIVISIIALLAGMVLSVGSSMQQKARIANTTGTILTIMTACEEYKQVFYLYPDLNRAPTDTVNPPAAFTVNVESDGGDNGGACSEKNAQIFNRRLCFMLEGRTYKVDDISKGPFMAESQLPKKEDASGNVYYADAWDQELLVWWGRNHSGETPTGPNYYNATTRYAYPLDIWSKGYDDTAAANVGYGDDATNGPGTLNLDEGTIDDIVSWRIKSAK